MTNTFATADELARIAAKIVGLDLGLAALVSRDLEADFVPGGGNTVRVRIPGAVEAHTKPIFDKSTPLESSEIAEQSVPVTLNTHAYSNVILSEGDLDLVIEDFSAQVLAPQSHSIVKFAEREVAAAMQATPETASIAFDEANPAKTFTQIRRALRSNGVSTDEPLLAAVGSDVYAALLDAEDFDTSGEGRIRGFEVHESTRLAPGEIVGFIRPAFSLVVRAPRVPDGAPFGKSVVDGGFALRYLRSYDGSVAADRSLVSAFVGVSAMPLAVDGEDGTVSLKANGGAVRVLTAQL
ncbi:MAG: coat protein- protein 5 [Solirubrobacterales bacterium]|nr:coat protein- protein 5 [Solirubrobacterales bacterium]